MATEGNGEATGYRLLSNRVDALPSLLVLVSAWAATAPFVATAVGADPRIPLSVELVDHLLPGGAMLAGALMLVRSVPRAAYLRGAAFAWVLATAGTVFVAAMWITAVHASLLVDARGPRELLVALGHGGPGPLGALIAGALYYRLATTVPAGAQR